MSFIPQSRASLNGDASNESNMIVRHDVCNKDGNVTGNITDNRTWNVTDQWIQCKDVCDIVVVFYNSYKT